MTDDVSASKPAIPALFATIHFRSDERPDGYSDEDIAELNELANVGSWRTRSKAKTQRKIDSQAILARHRQLPGGQRREAEDAVPPPEIPALPEA